MWKFTEKQIQDFKEYRQKHLPEGYTVDQENDLITHHCVTLLPELFKVTQNQEQSQTLISYAAVLFKRFYLIRSIFDQQDLHQFLLISNYLGMKLHGIKHDNILSFADIMKKKPKHQAKQHFGDEMYAKYEMIMVQTLGYDIDIKPLYQIVISINSLLNTKELLEQFLFVQYEKELIRYFHRALQGFTIFLFQDSILAFAIVECSLQILCSELFNSNSSIVGPSSRPVKQTTQEKLKKLSLDQKTNNKLIIQLLESLDLIAILNENNNNINELQKAITCLYETKDQSKKLFDQEWATYKLFKNKVFPFPYGVEYVDMKKQIQQ